MGPWSEKEKIEGTIACYRSARRLCRQKGREDYAVYGRRGIRFLFKSYHEIVAAIGLRPSVEYELRRVDRDGNFAPGNVVWFNRKTSGAVGGPKPRRKKKSPKMRRWPRKYYSEKGQLRGTRNSCYSAKGRCQNPNATGYRGYGGRGVEWKFKTPQELIDHIGLRPTQSHTLHRIMDSLAVPGHYEVGNVKWATKREQSCHRLPNGSHPKGVWEPKPKLASVGVQSAPSLPVEERKTEVFNLGRFRRVAEVDLCEPSKTDFSRYRDLGWLAKYQRAEDQELSFEEVFGGECDPDQEEADEEMQEVLAREEAEDWALDEEFA